MPPSGTAFTDLVGCRLPVQLAPMGGGVGSVRLAAAVTEAGGLGMLSASGAEPFAEQLAAVRRRTSGPVGVGWFAFDVETRAPDLELAARESSVVDVFWGHPVAAVVARIHAGGALAFWQAGSRDEAVAAADAGCDAVVVQGVEAGGHVRGTTPLHTLLEQVVPVVGVPVVAAGGIATATKVREVLEAGAAAVRIGTRFLATTDSAAHPDYVAALLTARASNTVLTTAYSGGWPDAPHRVLRRSVDAAAALAGDVAGETELAGRRVPVARWSALPPTSTSSGRVDAMAMYAGSGVDDVTDAPSVAEVMARLFPSAGE